MDAPVRRDPETIFAAHQLDPTRCELFVEGAEDRHFLEWLVGAAKHPAATVTEMAFVDMPTVVAGGERGRLWAFATQALDDSASIRFFADADFDRLQGIHIPPNIWLTDGRDLEGYLVRADCIEKVWRLALNSTVDAAGLLANVVDAARTISFLRLASLELGLDLPFKDTALAKHVTATSDSIEVDRAALVGALLQNAQLGLNQRDDLLQRADAIAKREHEPACDLVHGKDFLDLLTEILLKAGISRRDARKCLWTSFESRHVAGHNALTEVMRYLETCCCA
jgi:hypothetical protein